MFAAVFKHNANDIAMFVYTRSKQPCSPLSLLNNRRRSSSTVLLSNNWYKFRSDAYRCCCGDIPHYRISSLFYSQEQQLNSIFIRLKFTECISWNTKKIFDGKRTTYNFSNLKTCSVSYHLITNYTLCEAMLATPLCDSEGIAAQQAQEGQV